MFCLGEGGGRGGLENLGKNCKFAISYNPKIVETVVQPFQLFLYNLKL